MNLQKQKTGWRAVWRRMSALALLVPALVLLLGVGTAAAKSVETPARATKSAQAPAKTAKTTQTPAKAANWEPVRIAGASRYDVAAAVSRSFFPDADGVVLVNATAFGDAISAANLSQGQFPVLYTAADALPAETRKELQRKNRRNIYVLGGPESIHPSVLESVRAAVPGAKVYRIGGASRFAVNVAAAKTRKFGPDVVIANGLGFADALAATPLAQSKKAPVLLVTPGSVPAEVREYLRSAGTIRSVTVVGGALSVKPAVLQELQKLTGVKPVRLSGADRYQLSALVAQKGYHTPARALVASGEVFSDALVAAPLSQRWKAPIVLVGRQTATPEVLSYLRDTASLTSLYVIGGPNTIAHRVVAGLGAWTPEEEDAANASPAGGSNTSQAGSGNTSQAGGGNTSQAAGASSSGASAGGTSSGSQAGSQTGTASGAQSEGSAGTQSDAPTKPTETVSVAGYYAQPRAFTDPDLPRAGGNGTNHNPAASIYAYSTSKVRAAMDGRSELAGGKRVAFLTFDDGISQASTPQLLDILNQEGVPVTMFSKGMTWTSENLALLSRIYREGHALAAHSYDHDYSKLYPNQKGDAAEIVRQWQLSQSRMDELFSGDLQLNVWRYPGGHMSWKELAAADAALAEKGVIWIDWNAESDDANRLAPDTVQGQIDHILAYWEKSGQPNCVVVLMHDSPKVPLTLKALPKIIGTLRELGFSFGVLE